VTRTIYRKHVIIFLVFFGLVIGLFTLGKGGLEVGLCDPRPRDRNDGVYLAYCGLETYRDFEHGAILNGLVWGLKEHLGKANILMLGNSLTQTAFSSSVVTQFFRNRGWSHYVMGFGFAESSPFARDVINRHGLRPNMLIINVDPFFTSKSSEPAQSSKSDPLPFIRKTIFQTLHRWIPFREPACYFYPRDCTPWRSIYRRVENGHWVLDYFPHNAKRYPVEYHPNQGLRQFDTALQAAKVFFDGLKIDRRCVVLTSVPSNSAMPRLAKKLAERLETSYLMVDPGNIQTFDRLHMAPESAGPWNKAFLRALAPHIERCR
jgi:hypothetical protein